MSTQQKTRQQVYISLEKLGFDREEIEDALNACQASGLLYNVDWCCYYLTHLKPQMDLNTNTHKTRTQSISNTISMNNDGEEEEMDSNHHQPQTQHTTNTFLYLSDLNETIFSEITKCNGFILNGHKSERHERILERINKIYNVLFDFLYETQMRTMHTNITNKKMGFKSFNGRLSKYIMHSMIFEQLMIDDHMANTLASILKLENIFNVDYARDEFNILLRLISLHQYEMDETFLSSFVDYGKSIIKLPHIQITNEFIDYLERRNIMMNINRMTIQKLNTSLSSNTQLSNQYALGPPSNDIEYHSNDVLNECRQRLEEKQSNQILINLNECSSLFANIKNNTLIVSHLFNFYSSQFAHTFIEEGNDYNYIPQEASVELFLSSKLAQHILEIIWNEAKPANEVNDDTASGLNEAQFILATQLIALAQHNLPYNKHHLLSLSASQRIQIPLASMQIDAAFISYFKSNFNSVAFKSSKRVLSNSNKNKKKKQKKRKSSVRYTRYSSGGKQSQDKKQNNHARNKHSKHISAPVQVPYLSSNISTNTVSSATTTHRQQPLTQLIPYIPHSHIANFMVYFEKLDRKKRQFVSGSAIGRFFRKSGLNENILAQVWDLSDIDNDGRLSSQEFCVAMHLINCVRQGAPLPNMLPESLAPSMCDAIDIAKRSKSKQCEKKKKKKKKKKEEEDDIIPFQAHLNLSDLSQLQISQFVDYRGDDGKYICAQIIDIDSESKSNLLLRTLEETNNNNNNTFWCNYHTEMWRIAASQSITRRAVTRKEMLCYRIGDRIDINPYHTEAYRGWKLGYILDFDFGQALVSIANLNAMYWIHVDNTMEAMPPNQHSQKYKHKQNIKHNNNNNNNNNNNYVQQYSKTPKPIASHHHHRNHNRRRSKKQHKHGHNKRRASDLTKQETQEIINCIRSARKQSKKIKKKHGHKSASSKKYKSSKCSKIKSAHNKMMLCHKEDMDCNIFDGYRSPFREFEENPHKKLKLLPQDSNASETAGFVMVNYPNAAFRKAEEKKEKEEFGSAQINKEVQYVLKKLNIDNNKNNKRHTLPINAMMDHNYQRKNSSFTTYHHDHEPYYNHVNPQNGQRYHSLNVYQNNNNNNNKKKKKHNPQLENQLQHYSNTAPSTPIKLAVKRFKYRSRNKKQNHHHLKTHNNKLASKRSKSKNKLRKAKHREADRMRRKSSRYIKYAAADKTNYRHTDIV